MKSSDPPCDFDAFVAQRYGISQERASELIRYWLINYVPQARCACGEHAQRGGGGAPSTTAIDGAPLSRQNT